MTPKTQSVCGELYIGNSDHFPFECNKPKGHKDPHGWIPLDEPVAEPASTGEPQSCPCPCHKGESVICNCGGGFECEYINSIPAARPSEPSAPHIDNKALPYAGRWPSAPQPMCAMKLCGGWESHPIHHNKAMGNYHPFLAPKPAAPQPVSGDAPKVEEVARKLHLYHCQERRSGSICPCHVIAEGMSEGCHCKEETADIVAILRPFPPASQTPHAERMLELIAKRVGYTNQDEGLISFIVSRLAIPASTARTDEDEIIKLSLETWRYGCFVGKWNRSEAFRFNEERDAIEEKLYDALTSLAESRGLKHVQFAAPGSVPQAPKEMSLKPHNPCNLLCQHDILHDECLPCMSALATEYFEAWEKECKLTAKLTADIQRIADKAKGVPQAEPPKEEKP